MTLILSQLFFNSLISGSIYALIALGFTLIYKTVKFFHFAHGVIYAAGAYVAYTFFTILQVNFIYSFILAVGFAGILGIVINQFVYDPLRDKKAPNLIFLLVSFGVFILIQNFIALVYGSQVLTMRLVPVTEGYTIFGAVITLVQIIILAVSLVLMLALWIFIQKTKLGMALRAVSDDPLSAQLVGINTNRIILIVFAIGSILAGTAGILISMETNLEPTMGLSAIFSGIIASIIGGIGSIPGAVVGGFFLGFIENYGTWLIPSIWKDTISFAVLIIFLLIRPRGFFGIATEKELI